MAVIFTDYLTFKALVAKTTGLTVFYAPVGLDRDIFLALATGAGFSIFYSGTDPGTFAADFPLATAVLSIYPYGGG